MTASSFDSNAAIGGTGGTGNVAGFPGYGYGGGIYNKATAYVKDSSFTCNSADYGGGMDNGPEAPVTDVSFSTFKGNTARIAGPNYDYTSTFIDQFNTVIVGPIVVKSPGKQASAVGVAQAINLGSFADPNAASSWTETIDWGDNTSSTLHLPPGSLGKLNHTYAKKGTRTVTVTVTDNLGVTASYSFTVSVSAKNNGPNSSPAVSSAALGAGLGTSTSNASAISNNGAGA